MVFQVISERNERGSVIVTTNLPFGEWTKVFADARLAKASSIVSPTGRTSSRPVASRGAFTMDLLNRNPSDQKTDCMEVLISI